MFLLDEMGLKQIPAREIKVGDSLYDFPSERSIKPVKVFEAKTVEHLKCGTHVSDGNRTWCYNTPGNLVITSFIS